MQKHIEVQAEDIEKEKIDCKKTVQVSPTFDKWEPEINEMLQEFTNMWDGHLGTIKTVKHHIDLDPPEAKPIHSAPYRAGPAARQLKKSEIDKMLQMGVIEPAQNGIVIVNCLRA